MYFHCEIEFSIKDFRVKDECGILEKRIKFLIHGNFRQSNNEKSKLYA